MKIFQRGLLGLLLVALAGMLSMAFTVKAPKTEKKETTFYYYILKENGDLYTESDYTVREEEAPMPCGGDADVCWIKAEDNGFSEPDITPGLEDEIGDALSGHSDSDNVKLKN